MCIRDSIHTVNDLTGQSAVTGADSLQQGLVCAGRAAAQSRRLHRSTPVSYTHLDVYKRQERLSLRNGEAMSENLFGLTVAADKGLDDVQ